MHPDDRSSEGPDAVEYGRRRILIVVAVMIAALLETLDVTIVNVAIPTIEGNLGADISEGAWIVTGYMIANVVSIPLNPLMTKLLGRRGYYLGCIAGFTIASCLCGLSTSLAALVASRVAQGLFGGGLIATSQNVLRDTLPRTAVAASSGLFAIAVLTGPAIGPALGGYLTDTFSWRWIFYVNALPGLFSAAVLFVLLREGAPRSSVRLDSSSVALLAVGLGALQWTLDNGERLDWFDDRTIVAGSVAALAGIVAFIVRQFALGDDAILDLRLVRKPKVALALCLTFAFGFSIYAPAVLLPVFCSTVLGYDTATTGTLLALRGLPILLMTPVFATIAEKSATGTRLLLIAGFAFVGFEIAQLGFAVAAEPSFDALLVPLLLSSFAQSMLLVPLLVGVAKSLPAAEAAVVTPMMNLLVQLGGSVGVAMSVVAVQRELAAHVAALRGLVTQHHFVTVPFANGLSAATVAGALHNGALSLAFRDGMLLCAAAAAIGLAGSLVFPSKTTPAGGTA